VQAAPHAPQFDAVLMSVSQPLVRSPSQSAKPSAHAGAHDPDTQLVVPCAFVQLVPHAPQFAASV
jgi:hypothetical protein